MAMTGMRMATVRLGLIEQVPPEAVAEQKAPALLARLSEERRHALIELLHWTYGAGAGVVFSALPARLRERRWSGPVYGLGIWLFFEWAMVPALGLRRRVRREARDRAALAADHLLYGAVLGEGMRG